MEYQEIKLAYTEMTYPLEGCVPSETNVCPIPWKVNLLADKVLVYGLFAGTHMTSTDAHALSKSSSYKNIATPVKDYVIYVESLETFKKHLASDSFKTTFITGKDATDVKVQVPKVLIHNASGSSVSVARAQADHFDYFHKCEGCKIIGEAKETFISSVEDINFYTEEDREKYYSVHSIEVTTYTDAEGVEQEFVPAMLHGTMASKPLYTTFN